jgi:hypothetical protein
MKIFDCFTLYNELDLLELRLAELYDHVDYFVIVESDHTFTNRHKPFNFLDNAERFSAWSNKIRYVKLEDSPKSSNPWNNEHFQRNAIQRGIADADPDDIIVVTDVDEIPRPAALDHMRTSDQTIFALRMPIYNFKFNYMKVNPDRYNVWGMAARRPAFDDLLPNTLRDLRFSFFDSPYQYKNAGCELVEHAGWHFTYMGNNEQLKDKAQSFSHQEVNNPEFLNQIDVDASIAQRTSWDRDSSDVYEIVELDSYFPVYLQQNRDKYKTWILDKPVARVLDLLPDYPYNT